MNRDTDGDDASTEEVCRLALSLASKAAVLALTVSLSDINADPRCILGIERPLLSCQRAMVSKSGDTERKVWGLWAAHLDPAGQGVTLL